MQTVWIDPELSRQSLESALAAVSLSFIMLAALVALLAGLFVARECLGLIRGLGHERQAPATSELASVRLVYRPERSARLPWWRKRAPEHHGALPI